MPNFEDWFFKFNGWSFSRHQLMKFCKRAYYYRYIAGAMKYSPSLDIPKIKRLKYLKSKYVIQGTLIHDAIEDQLNQHFLGRDLNQESAQGQYLKRLEGFRKTADEMIIEYVNGEQRDAAFFENMQSSGLEILDTFFRIVWPNLKSLEYLKHEKFDNFTIEDVPVIVKLDYITKNRDGKLVLTDWKTGKEPKEGGNNLQIGTYVLWATENYKVQPEDIFSEVIYLSSSGRSRPYKFSFDQLEEIKQIIVTDFKGMNASYEMEYFPPDPFPKKCVLCQYAQICSDSKHKENQCLPPEEAFNDPIGEMIIDIE